MRTTLLLLALTTGCFFGDGPEVFDPGGGPATRPDAGAVVDASAPVPVDACTFGCWAAVELGSTFPFGTGTEYRVGAEHAGTGAVVYETSDAAIADVAGVEVSGSLRRVRVRGNRAGTTTLIARHGDTDEILDTTPLTVVDVATVELAFRSGPGLDAPVAGLAALAGTTDAFAIIYRDADGERLSGRGGFATTGAITIEPAAPFRPSDLFAGGAHARVAVTVSGSGTLTATLANDARSFAWPIDVVAAPSTISLVPMWLDANSQLSPLPSGGVKVGSYLAVDVIGRTSGGRFVAGVEARWSAPAALTPSFTSTTMAESEAVYRAASAGTHTVSALVGATTYTQQVLVVP